MILAHRIAKGFVRRAHFMLVDRHFDRRHGIETFEAGGDNEAYGRGNFGYASSPPAAVRHAIRSLAVDPSNFVFVDLGSGKGRILFVAAAEGFARVEGVEYSPDLHEAAKQNLGRASVSYRSKIVTHCVSAESYRIPDEPCVFYLYNPFGADVLSQVLKNIEASWLAHPRPMYVIYVNALKRDVFARFDFLEPARRPLRYRLLDPLMLPHKTSFFRTRAPS